MKMSSLLIDTWVDGDLSVFTMRVSLPQPPAVLVSAVKRAVRLTSTPSNASSLIFMARYPSVVPELSKATCLLHAVCLLALGVQFLELLPCPLTSLPYFQSSRHFSCFILDVSFWRPFQSPGSLSDVFNLLSLFAHLLMSIIVFLKCLFDLFLWSSFLCQNFNLVISLLEHNKRLLQSQYLIFPCSGSSVGFLISAISYICSWFSLMWSRLLLYMVIFYWELEIISKTLWT